MFKMFFALQLSMGTSLATDAARATSPFGSPTRASCVVTIPRVHTHRPPSVQSGPAPRGYAEENTLTELGQAVFIRRFAMEVFIRRESDEFVRGVLV